MTVPSPGLDWGSPNRRAVVLAPSFGLDANQGFLVRMVAGALALDHQVDIWTLAGPGRWRQRDGALTVSDLGSTGDDGAERAWEQAAEHLRVDPPKVLLFVGDLVVRPDDLLGADGVLARAGGPRTAGLPLTGLRRPRCLAPWRAVGALLAGSRPEATALVQAIGRPVTTVGAYLAVNPFALTEPPWFIGSEPCAALVDCSPASTGTGGSEVGPAPDEPVERLGAWLSATLAGAPLVAVSGTQVLRWPHGERESIRAVTSRSDLWRIMAHAGVVVPVGPELAVARCVLESLLLGTPVLAPPDSLGAALAFESRGGLPVPADWRLARACRWLLEHPQAAGAAGALGRQWAAQRFGDAAAFVRRVRDALDLSEPDTLQPAETIR